MKFHMRKQKKSYELRENVELGLNHYIHSQKHFAWFHWCRSDIQELQTDFFCKLSYILRIPELISHVDIPFTYWNGLQEKRCTNITSLVHFLSPN